MALHMYIFTYIYTYMAPKTLNLSLQILVKVSFLLLNFNFNHPKVDGTENTVFMGRFFFSGMDEIILPLTVRGISESGKHCDHYCAFSGHQGRCCTLLSFHSALLVPINLWWPEIFSSVCSEVQ